VDNFEIILGRKNPTYEGLITWYSKPNIKNLMEESIDVLKTLHKYPNYKKFYKILVKSFNDACDDFSILVKYIVKSERYKIIYKNESIIRNYIGDFGLLSSYRSTYAYVYYFL